uniref:TPR_REGION domain-containing protein n=1 Tax=Heterorhabditis bacteriophora TaxID=37862 RepID=A0A1I7WPI7_HETBA
MDMMRDLEVMPTFTVHEKSRYHNLTSLDFNCFYSNGDPRQCPERNILFKANRILESRHDYLMSKGDDADKESVRKQLFEVFLKMGHVAVLAQDWAKALSAYQGAYKLRPSEYWKDPGGYFGLGLVYIHFKEYKL